MALLYTLASNVAAFSLLSPAAAKATTVDGQQATAEALLGLREPVYTDARDVERITLAIVHQMNFQAAQGVDPRFMSSAASSQSKQNNVFRDRVVDPLAASLVAAVASQYAPRGAFADTFTSHRTRAGTG